ncbi:MAG: 3-keto-disaccharide hydrolase, partial [Bryobacteraceae bacterium]
MKTLALCALLAADPNGSTSLFNGRNLDGWEGDTRVWRVENGVLVGTTDEHRIERNTFLIHRDAVANFVLNFQVRLRNGNSGVQFRSSLLPGPGWVAQGYQADLSDAGERSAWGNFYEEGGRGRSLMRTQDEGWQRAQLVMRPREWND